MILGYFNVLSPMMFLNQWFWIFLARLKNLQCNFWPKLQDWIPMSWSWWILQLLIVKSMLLSLTILEYIVSWILVCCNWQMGRKLMLEAYAKLSVKIRQYHGHVTCVVNKLHDGTKLILGDGCWINAKHMLILNPNLFYHLEHHRNISLKTNPLIKLASISSIKKIALLCNWKKQWKKKLLHLFFYS